MLLIAGTLVNMLSFTADPNFRFIRGYYDPLPFSVTLRNDDSFFNVVAYPGLNRPNFNFTLWVSSSDLSQTKRRKRETSAELGPYIADVNEDLTAGVNIGDNITFTGTITAMVTREMCADFDYFCLEMKPADTASFELSRASVDLLCLNASAFKNCEGKCV